MRERTEGFNSLLSSDNDHFIGDNEVVDAPTINSYIPRHIKTIYFLAANYIRFFGFPFCNTECFVLATVYIDVQ